MSLPERYIGLMSGTSVNGVDVALAQFDPHPRLLAVMDYPMPPDLREQALALGRSGTDELHRGACLDNALAECFAESVLALLAREGVSAQSVRAIGCHGQTVRHVPPDPGVGKHQSYTVQLGNPSLIAELTGILTVADFRRRDMAAGGHGAPLAPAFHAAFLSGREQGCAVVNIGGISNVSIIPARSQPALPIIGYDTGPGNALMDSWIERHLGLACDEAGQWAASGAVQSELLTRWLREPYFSQGYPKSTGRELFNLEWLGSDLQRYDPADVQATLLELSVESIAQAIGAHSDVVQALWVCGGGVHNRHMMQRLSERLAPLLVDSFAVLNIDPDYLEAFGFAWLARQTLLGLPGNVPAVTGAQGARILGGIYPA